ncbi:hypothetical protein L2725_03235 [Shewanella corallii]|uniref:ATP-binding protein n=1 Tax=Shewanella corallii TaxID=560080 RepID=A0ABT0N2Y1_9GAMM|nr:hypothetical protein [Shewanella corallii]MCL2912806.1 hypothetical protein [Shewanella corallii]
MIKVTQREIERIKRFNLTLRKGGKSSRVKKKGRVQYINNWFQENSDFISLEKSSGRYTVVFPESLNLYDGFNQSIKPINSLRKILSFKRGGVRLRALDLNAIQDISTPASLVLTAEIDNWNTKNGRKLTPQTERWHPNVRGTLSELGFFELFNYQPCAPNSNGLVKVVKFIKGKPGDEDKAKHLREQIEKIVGSRVKRPPLFQALSEAITNVTHHAYPKEIIKARKHWYMTASFCEQSRKLKVAFYDQGIGIPSSLPKSKFWESAKGYIAKMGLINDHPSLIAAAVEMGRTSTNSGNRGKGLQDLLEFIRQYGNGYLSIMSQRGHYRFSCIERQEKIQKNSLDFPIMGTLIIWSVTIPERGVMQ